MPSDIAISVRNLTKTYRLFGRPGDRVKQFLSIGLRQYHRGFTALKNVSLDIRKGETVGIIGRNGSGKSTLLQLICGILRPTSGSVQVDGRISALLELGAGFNPEFTGRENVYFQGTLMGLAKAQIDERFGDIAAFADIGEFIDQPVRTYSSGMFVRLAFAAAVHVEPDILIIDEVLAVGDTPFQKKCFDRIYAMQSRGTTIVVVSHNPYHIERLCDRATVLRRGEAAELRPAKEVLALYHELAHEDLERLPEAVPAPREGTQDIRFEKVWIESAGPTESADVRGGAPLRIVARIAARQPIDGVRFRFEVFAADNELVAVVASNGLSEGIVFDGSRRIAFEMTPCQLTSGWYCVDAIAGHRHVRLDTWPRAAEFRVLVSDADAQSLSHDRGRLVCLGHWDLS